MIVGFLILIVITVDRRRSSRWLDEVGVGLLLDKVRSAMQRILVQLGLSRKGASKGSGRWNYGAALIRKDHTDRRRGFDLLDFLGVFLVVKAISKQISKVTQGSLQGICYGLFPTLGGRTRNDISYEMEKKGSRVRTDAYLVKGSSFALGVLHHSVSHVLVVCPISERDSNDGSNPNAVSLRVWIIVREIASDIHNSSAPTIETEDFVGKIDDLPTLSIGEFHPAPTRSRGDEFWTQFLIQFGLESSELHFCILREIEEGVIWSTRERVLRVVSPVHRGIERSLAMCGYRIVLVCRVGHMRTFGASSVRV